MATATEHCPWCNSVITHEHFVEIQKAIRAEEQRKLAEAKREMTVRIEREVAAKFSTREQKLAADQQKLLQKQQVIDAERAKIAQERQSLAATAKRQVEAAKEVAEKQRVKELAEQRQILQKDKDESLLKKDAAIAREREAWQKKILELNRRIEKQNAGDAGDGAEIDLFEELRAEFSSDKITRIQKGKPGGDILHEVQYKGELCGSILIDSKNRQAWNVSFVKKLRQDQTDAGANHAILSTTIFPAGKKELFIESGVIVVAPARVLVIVDLLRKFMVSAHVAKLGDAERATKLTRLYAFMNSTEFKQKLAEAEALVSDALKIDVDEKRDHDNVWKKRGSVLQRMKHVLREIDTDISAIIEARDVTPVAAMTARSLEH